MSNKKSKGRGRDIRELSGKFTLFNGVNNTTGRPADLGLLISAVKNPTTGAKLSAKVFGGFTCATKSKASVIKNNSMSLLTIDIDKGDLAISEVERRLSDVGIESYVIYGTFWSQLSAESTREHFDLAVELVNPLTVAKHQVKERRYRVAIPLARVVDLDKWRGLMEGLNSIFDGDKVMLEPNQISFMPNCVDKKAVNELYEYRISEGALLGKGNEFFDNALAVALASAVVNDEYQAGVKIEYKGYIDTFNGTADIHSLLIEADYTKQGEKYLPPDSASGKAGLMILEDGQHCLAFNGSDLLNDGYRHSCYDVLLMILGGDEDAVKARICGSFNYLTDKWAYIASDSSWLNKENNGLYRADAVNNIETVPCRGLQGYDGKSISPIKYLIQHSETLKVETRGWRINGSDTFALDGVKQYNTYKPSKVVAVPLKGAELGLFSKSCLWLQHIEWLVPDNVQRRYLLQWLGFLVQFPERKCNNHILLGGGEGIGKDTILRPIISILGEHNCKTVTNQQLDSDFNQWAFQVKLCVFEELKVHKKDDMYNKLKPYMTAPPELLTINMKMEKEFMVENVMAIFAMSNDRLPINIGSDTRRIYGIWSDRERTEKKVGYWNALHSYIDKNISSIYGYLRALDLTGFSPTEAPVATRWVTDIGNASGSPELEMIKDMVTAKEYPFESGAVKLLEVKDVEGLEGCKQSHITRLLTEADFSNQVISARINGVKYNKRLWIHKSLDGIKHSDILSAKYPELLESKSVGIHGV